MNDNFLYNTQTRKKETLPEGEIENAILSGTHSFKAGQRVNVVNEDGESFSVPTEQVKQALGQGYKLETAFQAGVKDYVEENKGLKGSAKVFGKQLMNQALFGVPGIIEEHTADPFEAAKSKALETDHAFANALGGVTGFAGSLAVGAPLFKGAAKAGEIAGQAVASQMAKAGISEGASSVAARVAARMAEKGTQLGVEGAISNVPRIATEAALGDYDAAAESLLYGAGIGAGFGVASGALSPAFKAIGSKLKSKIALKNDADSFIDDFQNERASKALGFSKGQIKKLKQGADEAKDIGLFFRDLTLDDGTKVMKSLDSTDDIFAKTQQYIKQEADKVSNVYQTIDETGQQFYSPTKTLNKVEAEIGDFYRSDLNKDVASLYDNAIDSIKNLGGGAWFREEKTSLKDAKNLLDQLDNIAFPGGKTPIQPTPKQEIAYKIRKILRNDINEAADEAAKSIGVDNLANTLQASNANLTKALKAKKALEDKLSSEQGNKLFGLTDTITGVGAGAGAGIAPAIAAVAGKKLAEKYGNQIIANLDFEGVIVAERALRKVAQSLDQIPQALDNTLSKVGSSSKTIRPAAIGSLSSLLDEKEQSFSPQKKFETVSNKVNEWVSNPSYSTQKIAELTEPFAQMGAPNVAERFQERYNQAMQYLASTMPKPISVPNPFNQREWKPSDSDLMAFQRRLEIIQNPFSAVDLIQNNKLTKEHVEALSAVYPRLYREMQKRVIDHMSTKKSKVPYSTRLKLSLLMGGDFDPSIGAKNISSFQTSYNLANPQQAAQAGGPNINIANNQMTDVQRIEAR